MALPRAVQRTTVKSSCILSSSRRLSHSACASFEPPDAASVGSRRSLEPEVTLSRVAGQSRRRSISTIATDEGGYVVGSSGGDVTIRKHSNCPPRKGDAIFAPYEIHWPLAFATQGGGGDGALDLQHRQRIRLRASAEHSTASGLVSGGGSRRQMSSSSAALASFDDDSSNRNGNDDNRRSGVNAASARAGTAAAAGGAGDMKILPFKLADIGEGIKEVELLQWFVQEGDAVRQFDKVCEVQSDKATVEITSRYDGVVGTLHWKVGEVVQTGSALMDVLVPSAGGGGGTAVNRGHPDVMHSAPLGPPQLAVPPVTAVSSFSSLATSPAVNGSSGGGGGAVVGRINGSSGGGGGGGDVRATPAVRRLAREYNVDLQTGTLTPTGAKGRIMKADLLNYVAALRHQQRHSVVQPSTSQFPSSSPPPPSSSQSATAYPNTHASPPPSPVSSTIIPPPTPTNLQPGAVDVHVGVAGQVMDVKGVRKAMMAMMGKALDIPHMVYCDEIVMDKLVVLRDDLRKTAKAKGPSAATVEKISYLPIIVKAASLALTKYPILNASLSDCGKKIFCHADHNIGIAMDTPKGLVVPCVKQVNKKSIIQIAEALAQLHRRGMEGRLSEADLQGATFTVSNIGSIGGTYTSPVIMHPQVAIGALGRMQTVPRYVVEAGKAIDENSKVVPQKLLHVSWGADHRIIDGSTLARFSNTFKSYVENPAIMLAEAT